MNEWMDEWVGRWTKEINVYQGTNFLFGCKNGKYSRKVSFAGLKVVKFSSTGLINGKVQPTKSFLF